MKTRIPLGLCLVAAMTALPAFSPAASNPDTLDLLKGVRTKASDASLHASNLESMARSSTLGWEADADQLQALKEDINNMGKSLAQLEQIRKSATLEERNAIDRAAPLVRLMADNTQAAIQFLNENRGKFWEHEYQQSVDNLANESSQLSKSLGHFVKLEKVRTEEKQLETSLGSEAGS